MNMGVNSLLSEQIAAAMAWWEEAGVDSDFVDAPQCWLAEEKLEEEELRAQLAPQIVTRTRSEAASTPSPKPLDRTTWPTNLNEFSHWWLTEPWLDNGQTLGRVAPRSAHGPTAANNAELMIIIPYPEKEDDDRLLSGPQGRLLGAMVRAMEIAPDAVYLASALPRYTPHADWSDFNQVGMGDVLRHHISLVAPKRLICFGGSILPLLGHDLANSTAFSQQFNHEAFTAPLFCARELALQLEKPRWKAGFWKNWLEWQAAE